MPWNSCSKSCGSGTQQRMRICSNPVPKNGGSDCQGARLQNRTCSVLRCPVCEYLTFQLKRLSTSKIGLSGTFIFFSFFFHTFRFRSQEAEFSSALTQTVPLECTHSFILLIHVCLLTTYELNIFLIPSFLDMLSNKYNLLSQPVGRLLQLMKDPSLLLIILKSTPAKQTARGLFVCDMDALSS